MVVAAWGCGKPPVRLDGSTVSPIMRPGMEPWSIVITGCGTSHGNPLWGFPDCWSTDPRDRRRRSGAMLFGPQGQVVLIDTGPDLLHQLRDPYADWDGRSYPTRAVERCDGVLLTHCHADHSHGLNELRHLNRLMRRAADGRRTPIPIHGHPGHLAELTGMFPYCFGDGTAGGFQYGAPALLPVPVADGVPFPIAGLAVTPFALSHGPAGRTTGFRCGGMAYLTDLKECPEAAIPLLQNLDLLVLDMLREEPHPTHFCWSEALDLVNRLRPARTVLTHLGPEVQVAAWTDRLPVGIEMAVDGWQAAFVP